ncbi:hypothetical protein [Sphingomonas baiyangensis]|uniref:Uncharacterized protein n=1 Tax=Sphingomonas baiyangensis TaxID=2572576 RepID=A0A4V5PTL3_9SPHN|nr:hypothetical protein [Sphingomonas baiyangensis]TKD50548.1 hypothetical protein FBR43_07065 [Sphingomonas baiyangensis]
MASENRQYVSVLFKPWDRRTYTYHNDGERVAEGDEVVVSTDRGPAVVTVASTSDRAPSFDTKPIVGKHRPIEASEVATDGV